MINRNEILKMDGIEYRVVQIFGDTAHLIQMNGQSVELIKCLASGLSKGVRAGRITVELDEWADVEIRPVSDELVKKAEADYKLIELIVENPLLYTDGGRKRLVSAVSRGDAQLERRINLILGTYWRRGQVLQSLVPAYGGATGPVSRSRKRGRRAADGNDSGVDLSPEVLDAMNEGCRRYLMGEGKLPLRKAYEAFVEDYRNGRLVERRADVVESNELPFNEYRKSSEVNEEMNDSRVQEEIAVPTFNQFYYFYRSRYGSLKKRNE